MLKFLIILLSIVSSFAIAKTPKELFKTYKPSTVKIVYKLAGVEYASGTGFFVSDKGHIVTNAHIFGDQYFTSGEVLVYFSDGTSTNKVLISNCVQKKVDLCFLKVERSSKVYFKLTDKAFDPGEEVYVIGHSLGLDYTFSDGLLSGKRNYKDINKKYKEDLMLNQISAPISQGNSGGPVFDSKGNLVGVATFMYGQKAGGNNLNFTIANTEVKKYFEEIKDLSYLSYKRKLEEREYKYEKMINKLDKALSRYISNKRPKKIKNTSKLLEIKDSGGHFSAKLNTKFFGQNCKKVGNSLLCIADYGVVHVAIRHKSQLEDLKSKSGTKNSSYKKIAKSDIFQKVKKDMEAFDSYYTQVMTKNQCEQRKYVFNNSYKPTEVCEIIIKNSPAIELIEYTTRVDIHPAFSLQISTMVKSEAFLDVFKKMFTIGMQYSVLKKEKYIPKKLISGKGYKLSAKQELRALMQDSLRKERSALRQKKRNERELKRSWDKYQKNKPEEYSLKGKVVSFQYYVSSESEESIKLILKNKEGRHELRSRCPIEDKCFENDLFQKGDLVEANFKIKKSQLAKSIAQKKFSTSSPVVIKMLKRVKEIPLKTIGKLTYISIEPERVYLTIEFVASRERRKIYIYGEKNIDKLRKANLQRNDLVEFGVPQFVDGDGRYIYNKELAKFKSTKPKVTVSENRESSRSRKRSNDVAEYEIQGIVKDVDYFITSSDKERYKVELKGKSNRVEISGACPIEENCFDLPIILKGDEIKVSFKIPERKYERYLKDNRFRTELPMTIKVLKKNSYEDEISGNVSHAKIYDDNAYIVLKNKETNKELKINVYGQKNLAVLQKINMKRNDYLKLGTPSHVEGDRRVIYFRKFDILEHVKSN